MACSKKATVCVRLSPALLAVPDAPQLPVPTPNPEWEQQVGPLPTGRLMSSAVQQSHRKLPPPLPLLTHQQFRPKQKALRGTFVVRALLAASASWLGRRDALSQPRHVELRRDHVRSTKIRLSVSRVLVQRQQRPLRPRTRKQEPHLCPHGPLPCAPMEQHYRFTVRLAQLWPWVQTAAPTLGLELAPQKLDVSSGVMSTIPRIPCLHNGQPNPIYPIQTRLLAKRP